MLIYDLIQHGECKEGHLVATKFKQFWINLAKLLPFLIFSIILCVTFGWV